MSSVLVRLFSLYLDIHIYLAIISFNVFRSRSAKIESFFVLSLPLLHFVSFVALLDEIVRFICEGNYQTVFCLRFG